MSIITRLIKGARLTWYEVDANFTQLLDGVMIVSTDGDKGVMSTDPSYWRWGTWSKTYGTFYTLLGDISMFYMSHNFRLDPATGNLLGCDDDGPCTLIAFVEGGSLLVRYDSQTTTAGQVPGVDAPWMLSFSIDASGFNGAIGSTTRHPVTGTAGNFNAGCTVGGAPLDLPVMTSAQKAASTSTAGSFVYDSDLRRPCFKNSTTWVTL